MIDSKFRPYIAPVVAFALGALIFGVWCGPETPSDPHAAHEHAAIDTVWTCSMHPQIRKAEAGACPICGMDLIPVASAENNTAPNRVVLSERARTLAKLTTVAVQRQSDASAEVRLLGNVEPNEKTLKAVTAWTGGRIDRLHVNVTGQRVRAGQVIATLYSPEIFAAHQDLLTAKTQVDRMTGSSPAARSAAVAGLEAARQRLRLVGVPDDELSRMETSKQPTEAVRIRTPFSGTVIERVASEGGYVEKGASLYRIADLRSLWVQLDAYESDLPRIAVGQPVAVRVEAIPQETFEGKLTFIDPTLDARRRTARVRVEVDNSDGRLRPGMFAEAVVTATRNEDERSPLVVPSTAPLFTGRRAVVYVEVPNVDRPTYEARTVRLGPRLGDVYPVVTGLAVGDRVVRRGAFVVDADLQIKGGESMMRLPDDLSAAPELEPITLAKAARQRLEPVVEGYLDLGQALAADDLDAAKRVAEQLLRRITKVKLTKPVEAADVWRDVEGRMQTDVRRVTGAKALPAARAGFEGLTERISTLLRRFGNPTNEPVRRAHCSMANGSKGASWFQRGDKIDNVYFGESMRTCGEFEVALEPGAFMAPPNAAASRPAGSTP